MNMFIINTEREREINIGVDYKEPKIPKGECLISTAQEGISGLKAGGTYVWMYIYGYYFFNQI